MHDKLGLAFSITRTRTGWRYTLVTLERATAKCRSVRWVGGTSLVQGQRASARAERSSSQQITRAYQRQTSAAS